MAGRSVVATLAIDGVEGVVAGFRRAGEASQEYGRVASKAGDQATAWVDKHDRDLDKVSGGLLKFGAVGGLALVGLAKSAMDWESAWAGVTKTVDGTPEQLQEIEAGLRGLAKTLPASHEEIAAVAEAAGQLGIQTDSVVDFTKTMIDLGETTNLSADEASSSLAQFMNVMGTSAKDVDRLGSSIVALGNDGASTERDIVQMGQRIAAAGKSVRMSETDVLGFASALSSTGIEAEAGGTAISKTFRQIDADVREGGKSLDLIAETAGMTSAQFTAAWQSDAAGAITSFVEGLGGMQASGEDANKVLNDLGMTGERQTDSIMRLANATKQAGQEQDLLRESLELGKTSWDENSALAEEAQKRYETRSAQMQMSINGIKDGAITLGESLLPVIDSVLGFVNTLVGAFEGIDGPTRDVGVAILTIGTAGALAVGGVMRLVTGLASAKAAINALGISVGTASKAMGLIGIAIAAAGTFLASWMGQQQEAKDKVEAYTNAIREQGEVIGEVTRDQAFDNLYDAGVLDFAKELGADLADVTDAALGSESAMARVTDAINATKQATDDKIASNQAELDGLRAKGALTDEELVRSTALINENEELNALQSSRVSSTGALMEAINGEAAATAEGAAKVKLKAEATRDDAEATDASAAASQADAEAKAAQQQAIAMTKEELDNLIAATQAYGNALLAQSNSQIGMDSAILDAADHMKQLAEEGDKASYTLDTQTRAGLENQRMLNDIQASTMNHIKTLSEQGASLEEIQQATDRGKAAWIAHRDALNQDKDETRALADEIFRIPDTATTEISSNATAEEKLVESYRDQIMALPKEKQTELLAILNQGDVARVRAELNALAASRDVWLRVHTSVQSAPVMGRTYASVNGNLFDYYASGGLREQHVAQIAPAGAWRVWAEPETGGEAYIPLARSKRPRSLQIWEETGRRLGVHGFADGAVLDAYRTQVMHSASETTNHYQVNLSFPEVRTAAQMEKVIRNLPQLARQNGVTLNGR